MNLKNIKGQIAIEYIIFIAIFLLFFQAIIYPNVLFAENVVQDVSNLTQTKKSIDSLSYTIEEFSNSLGYGKRSMFFYLPNSSILQDCNSSTRTIEYTVEISDMEPKPSIQDCNSITNICDFEKELNIGSFDIDCNSLGPGYRGSITIEKDATGEINVYS